MQEQHPKIFAISNDILLTAQLDPYTLKLTKDFYRNLLQRSECASYLFGLPHSINHFLSLNRQYFVACSESNRRLDSFLWS